MTRNQTVEINHLTVLQIQYLTELEQLEKGRGTIGAVAAKCGVKHPTVSRFFKSCIEKGYLTESLEFTDKGKKMLRWHQKVQKDVREYLERSGITEGIDDVLKGMIENIDYRRLEELTKSHMRINKEIRRTCGVWQSSSCDFYPADRWESSIHGRKWIRTSRDCET